MIMRLARWLYARMPDWVTGNWVEPEEDTGLLYPPHREDA